MESSFSKSEGWSLAGTIQLLFLMEEQSTSDRSKSLSVKSQI